MYRSVINEKLMLKSMDLGLSVDTVTVAYRLTPFDFERFVAYAFFIGHKIFLVVWE